MMPLPDADKKSRRVYTLLQNLDLENLTADNLADVGDPIAIEEANEDELRRLCLVAFARMVTKGSFDGWLSSAEGIKAVIPESNIAATYDRHTVTRYAMTGSNATGNSTFAATNSPNSHPFVSPESGVVDEIGIVISTGASNTFRIGIFSDTDLAPNVLLGYADIDTTSTATVYQTSWSSTVTLVRGTVYHLMWVRTSSGTSPVTVAESNSAQFFNSASDAVRAAPNAQCCLALSGSDNDLETPVTLANLTPTYNAPLRCTLKFA
jgi:hypothetical protein